MNRILLIAAAVLSTSSLLLVDFAIKGGVLLLLAALVALLLRRDSAATRHLVWQVSIVGLLVVPVFSAVLPQWRVLPAWAVIPASTVTEEPDLIGVLPAPMFEPRAAMEIGLPPLHPVPGSVQPNAQDPAVAHQHGIELPVTQAAVVVPVEILSEPSLPERSVLKALPILWLIGFTTLIARLLAARAMLWSGERRGTVIAASQHTSQEDGPSHSTRNLTDEAIINTFQTACQQLSVVRSVRLLIHAERTIPVVWGILRHRLLLPDAARTWSAEQLQSVLLHELAHIKRRDAIAQLLTQLACALHWFNPLVWFASWRLHVERERACDDLVLASGVRPSAYAEHLLDVATRLSPARWTQACGLAMARKSSLEGRLAAVLSEKLNRRSVPTTVGVAVLLVGIGIAVPVAMLHATDAVSTDESVADTTIDAPEDDVSAAPVPASFAKLKPKHEDGQKLFRIWQEHARTDGKIPGAWIGQLGEWVKYFIELNDGAGESGGLSAKFKMLLPRFDATHDWTQMDAVALLDDVGAVHRIPFSNALASAAERVILPGEPLPDELKYVSWGRRDASGLRVAWYLQHEDDRQTLEVEPHKQPGIWQLVPSPRTYPLGSVFKSRILMHNAGEKPVFFVMPSWQQSSTHAAHDDKGQPIEVTATDWTTMASMRMYRLAPGAYLETNAPGIGVGSRTSNEDWASLRPGAWIHAKVGDEVRLTPGNVEVRMSPFQVGTRHMNEFQKPKDAADLWESIVAERVSRELPIPPGAADREQLLRRVVRDLYGVDPAQSEIDAFVADRSPGSLHPVTGEAILRDRVKHNRKMSSFTGTLLPGEMTFRVLAADPQAGNGTRIATAPGYYILGDNQRLHVEQTRSGERRVNKATIRFFSPNPKTTPAAEPVAIPLPDGVNTFEIYWDRGSGVLWVTQKGLTRKYDFTDPADVKESRAEPDSSPDIPSFRDWAKDLPAVLEFPSDSPPNGPESTAGTKLEPGMEANFKWGATVNGLRAALSLRRTLDEPDDLYVVIQNVSDAPIHLDSAVADSRRLWIRLKGVTQMALSAKKPGLVDVMLQPREVAFVRVFSPESTGSEGRAFTAIIAESALKDQNWTMTVEFAVEQAPTGSWQGKLRTADTSGFEAAAKTTLKPSGKPVEKADAPQTQPQSGTKLEPDREDKLQWGEPVNGLRAALIRPPALGRPESTQTKDFQFVIQNVSKAPIRLVADATAPNPRQLTLMSRKHGWVQSRTRVEEPSDVDVLLRPGEVAILDLLPSAGHQGSSISRNLDLVFFGDMTIEKAPPGAWTGTLLTAEMHAAFAAHGLLPTHKDAREVFKIWNQGARLNRTIPGALIGLLADSVTVFTKSNPTWKTTPQLLQLLPRLDATRDWEPHDVVTLLDEVAAIQASPVSALLENELTKVMRRGKPLPKELASAPWGEAQPNGLRLAWLLEPQMPEVGIGTALKSRILIHNAGKGTVVFRARNWHQSNDHNACDADGADVKVSSTRWLTRTQVVPFRLNPGDYVELPAAAIGVGPRGDGAAWKNSRAGSWIEVKPGDEVTFQPASVALGVGEPDSDLNDAGSWWPALVTARLYREKPVPMDDEVRRRLVYHVGLDLGTSNGDEIVNAFLEDRQPNSLETLAKRLAEHTSPVPFTGSLVSGPTKFRVIASADATNPTRDAKAAEDAPARKPAPDVKPASAN